MIAKPGNLSLRTEFGYEIQLLGSRTQNQPVMSVSLWDCKVWKVNYYHDESEILGLFQIISAFASDE
jgi:hypothetical protein